jgi:hypothetical protein
MRNPKVGDKIKIIECIDSEYCREHNLFNKEAKILEILPYNGEREIEFLIKINGSNYFLFKSEFIILNADKGLKCRQKQKLDQK